MSNARRDGLTTRVNVTGEVTYDCGCGNPSMMKGGAMWQHLRGWSHVFTPNEATWAIQDAREKALQPSASEGG